MAASDGGYQPAGFQDLPPDLQAMAGQIFSGQGPAAPAAGGAPAAKVWWGENPGPDRGPALHADALGALGAPTDRGPATHYEPELAPWAEQRTKVGGPKETDVDSAMTRIYTDKVQQRFIDLLIQEGVIEKGNFSWDDIEGWWQKAVEGAAKAYTYGHKKITPYDWISMYAGVNGIGGSGAAGGGPTTTTSTSVQTIDDLDARGAANDAYSAGLGRRAKGREASALQAALNAYAKAHPSISTTTNDGEGNTSTTTSGGMSAAGAQQIAEDQVKAKPGYAEFQAATTVHNWLQDAIGGASGYGPPG